ncbi:hypothetical protein [Natrinema thermotolerans]|uniref:hypothetical protein n=1 Tax=Natrinema thermotolerans TaxID=121872 RepID=UPI000678560A|nr:hypothetical protein [Natrinema thermotolerans]QCC57274.1 hypothetical protein DVR14_00950 [Natrinema thermotolerans]
MVVPTLLGYDLWSIDPVIPYFEQVLWRAVYLLVGTGLFVVWLSGGLTDTTAWPSAGAVAFGVVIAAQRLLFYRRATNGGAE